MLAYARPEQEKDSKDPIQKKEPEQKSFSSNQTGIPDAMKTQYESLSGFSFDDVRVHYNSDKPSQLQALAYTQGNQVYVGTGQEKHLQHELGHVVQQKQGRVYAYTQVRGYKINQNVNLEAEADSLAEKASSLAPASKNTVSETGVVRSDITQMKIGFEFETGWLIDRLTDDISDVYEPLKKKDVIFLGGGFTVEADEASSGKSEIEFVTNAFEKKDELTKTSSYIESLGRQLIDRSSDCEYFNYLGCRIKPCDNNLSAGPQVSYGLKLNAIEPLARELTTKGVGVGVELESVKKPLVDISPNLGGLVKLIKNYIEAARGSRLLYPKQIADRFLLARTNFAKLLEIAIKEDAITEAGLTKEVWLQYFDSIQDVDLPLYKGIWNDEEDFGKGSWQPELTCKQWLVGIFEGVDLLTTVKDSESLGSYGKKTDRLGDTELGIFEYRSSQTKKIPLSEWRRFMEEWFDRIDNLNS